MLEGLPASPHIKERQNSSKWRTTTLWEFAEDFYRVTSSKQWTAYIRDAGLDATIELIPCGVHQEDKDGCAI